MIAIVLIQGAMAKLERRLTTDQEIVSSSLTGFVTFCTRCQSMNLASRTLFLLPQKCRCAF